MSKELVECYKPYCWPSGELCFASQVFFIESVCDDPTVVATNVRVSVEVSCSCFPSCRIFHLCSAGFLSEHLARVSRGLGGFYLFMMYLSWDEKGAFMTQGHLEVMKIKVVVAFPWLPSMLSAYLLICNLIVRTESIQDPLVTAPPQSPTFWKQWMQLGV